MTCPICGAEGSCLHGILQQREWRELIARTRYYESETLKNELIIKQMMRELKE